MALPGRVWKWRPGIEPKVSSATIFIAAPDGQAGGGMGRVKDYILASPADKGGRYRLASLVTRDGRGVAASLLLLLQAMLRLLRARLAGQAALLHVHMGDRGSIMRKGILLCFARLCGVPALLHLHAVELEALYAGSAHPVRWLIRLPFRVATAIIALGQGPKAFLTEQMSIAPEKIDILTNGVPSTASPPDRSARKGQPCRILFLGNLIERKGVSDLLEALARLGEGVGAWEATLAGGGGEAFYRSRAETLGIGGKVRFAGWVEGPDVQALLAWADLLVLPSYDEGLPLVILEALGHGLPVICTPVGAIPEVLHHDETALMVAPGDLDALTASLARLIAEPETRLRLGQAGRRLYDERLSLSAFQDALFSIYHRRCGVDYVPDRDGGVQSPCA